MCIRDRRILINNKFNKAINNIYHKQKKLNYTTTKHEQLTAIQPVSYTHLDVYKRQTLD